MKEFVSVIAAIIRESSDKQLVLRIVNAFLFIHQPDRVALKASDVSAANWLYQHTWKNTIFFHVCCYGFSQGRKSLYNTAVYVIKSMIVCYSFGKWHLLKLFLSRRIASLSFLVSSVLKRQLKLACLKAMKVGWQLFLILGGLSY